MLSCAEEVLRGWGCTTASSRSATGDMGFASQKTYDIEVWLPARTCIARFRPARCAAISRRGDECGYRARDNSRLSCIR